MVLRFQRRSILSVRIIRGGHSDCEVIQMVDFAEIRKIILAGEDEDDDGVAKPQQEASAWRKELDAFNTAAPLSIGAGLLGALLYDGVINRDEAPIFEGTWKTLTILTGAMLFGYGAGRLNRGTSAQGDAENYEATIAKAEEEAEEEKDKKEQAAEQQKESKKTESHLLYNHESFSLAPSSNGLMGFGEYGSAVGQQGISYRYMG